MAINKSIKSGSHLNREFPKILKINDAIGIVFSDIVMPGSMNRFELAKVITQAKSKIKVLLTSGYTSNIKISQSEDKWSKILLKKPYRNQQLSELIRQELDELHYEKI